MIITWSDLITIMGEIRPCVFVLKLLSLFVVIIFQLLETLCLEEKVMIITVLGFI